MRSGKVDVKGKTLDDNCQGGAVAMISSDRADCSTNARECNICGGSRFLAGPGGRLSEAGKFPRCASCQSLERHRTLRKFYGRLLTVMNLREFSCLQISDDRSVERGWFATHAVSVFGGQHSLDVQSLPMASGSYDCVICNHVLEHVADDLRAMEELYRVVSGRGFLQVGVPDPVRAPKTDDWGYPRAEDHGHFRRYGIDIVAKLRSVLGDGAMVRVVEADPVTGMNDLIFVLTRSDDVVRKLLDLYADAVVDHGPSPKRERAKAAAPYFHAAKDLRDCRRFDAYYIAGGHATVQGWLTPRSLSAVAGLHGLQRRLGVHGHVCEIGVHHGRFFIALSLLRKLGERSVAIDVFDLQELNTDSSGKEDRDALDRNVATWLAPDPDVVVMRADSLNVRAEDVVREAGGRIRLFSVDGSRTRGRALNDMRIAEGAVVEGGLVIVDDFLNPARPGVTEAVICYLTETKRAAALAPIGYGDNKFYFTTKGHLRSYRDFLLGWPRDMLEVCKPVTLADQDILFVSFPPADRVLSAATLAPNETIATGIGGTPLTQLGAASRPEAAGIWFVGEWAGIAFDLARTGPDALLRVAFKMRAFRHKADPEPCVGIHVGGEHVADAAFPAGADEVDAGFLIERRSLGPTNRVEVWFHNPRALAPVSIGLSTDKRKLSFFLISVRVEEQARRLARGG